MKKVPHLSQNMRVLKYMKKHPKKGITNRDAHNMDIERLSGRIFNLRAMGYQIETVRETRRNLRGEIKNYARYIYKGEPIDNE